jgi:hypothetical protein
MVTKQETELLEEHFGKYYPKNSEEARIALDRDGPGLSAPVYLALSNLLIENMGKDTSPKKKDRQRGRKIRQKRTGSRKG